MKIKRNPARAAEFKRSYFQLFGSTEVFLEAIPTVFVQIVILNEKSSILAQGGLGSTFFYLTFNISGFCFISFIWISQNSEARDL